MMNSSSIIKFLFELQHVIKLYHWNTTSYAQHMATDRTITSILPLIDQFVEIYLGKNKKMDSNEKLNITITNYNEKKFLDYAQKSIDALIDMKLDSKKDTDLLNIRDELVASLNTMLYLFKLK